MPVPTLWPAAFLAAVMLVPVPTAGAVQVDRGLMPFLEKHCFECHGEEVQKNDLRFDTLGHDLSKVESLRTWQDILDQLNRGEMPPKKKPQPAPAEAAVVVDALTETLREAYAQHRSKGARAVIRRLNRLELRYTLRDLLYLEGGQFRSASVAELYDNNGNGRVERPGADPISEFPADEEKEGFDNIGDRLVMSDFLLKLVIGAAEESIGLATHAGDRPKVGTRRYAAPIRAKLPRNNLEFWSRELNPDYDAIFQRYTHRGECQVFPDDLTGGVRTAARYRIRIEASAHNQRHPWGELIKSRQDEPMRLGLHVLNVRQGGMNPNNPSDRRLAEWELPGDGSKQTFTFETWLDESSTPWIGWENAPYDRAFRPSILVEKYLPDAFRPKPENKAPKEVKEAYQPAMAKVLFDAGYKGPHLRIHSMKLEPLIETWPPKSHTFLYGATDTPPIEELLTRFAQRAYRRPVSPEDIAPYVQLVNRTLQEETAPAVVEELGYKIYHGEWSRLPDFPALTPAAEGRLPEGLIDIRVADRDAHYGIVFEGKLVAPRAGEYQFELASDDGSRLVVAGEQVILHDGLHGASTKKGKIELKPGHHDFRVEYFAYGSPNSMRASWSGPGFGNTPLSATNTAPKPIAGGNAQTARIIAALQLAYTAILASPRFFYLIEDDETLDSYQIASRLSYFLWSSMPDEELFELAAADKLRDPEVLRAQVDRMLDHRNAAAFSGRFPERWLRLDKLGGMPPEKGGPFRIYWDRRLEPMMARQTEMYFSHLLQTNGPIREFIHSDYTFLNERIASILYRRDDIWGDGFRKVKLEDPRRGGVLTQPAVMTATANGVDTSPVVRGVWVLENILGTPPAPPPPDVEPLSPDLRNAVTIREQLAAHREVAACNNCHRKIDPLGFPFENFNAIGVWRDKYRTTKGGVDPSTELSDGTQIDGIVALKQALLAREDLVVRCLAEKLLTYASGRSLEPTDRGEIDRVVEASRAKGYKLRDLVHLVVQSEVFLSK